MPKTKQAKDYGMTHIAVMRETASKIRAYYKENKGTTIYKLVDDAVNHYINKEAQND